MHTCGRSLGTFIGFTLLLATGQMAHSQLLWQCGEDDNAYNEGGVGGGAQAAFVQENGGANALPGSPFGTPTPAGADDDYYFAGQYFTVIPANGAYDPVGVVDFDEEAAERAFTSTDLDLRYHFNLPENLRPTDLLSVTFDAFSLDGSGSDARFGIEVYFNNVLVQPQIVVRQPQVTADLDYTTPQFTLESVNAQVGPGFDNIVTLRGTSYSADGGGDWMGIDYVQLNQDSQAIPQPVLPWAVGALDNAWATGNGGGTNATFVEGNGSVNPLPGSATSTETAGGADNDYYLAGVYTNGVAQNGEYEPAGVVSVNEEAAERGFAGAENELRYHFNLPVTLQPTDLLAVTFGAINLDTTGADPRYGVEVYVNNVRVGPEVVIRSAQLNTPITTPQFTVAGVNAGVGVGTDNIITLRGISYSATGGGNSLGIDYVQLVPVAQPIPDPELPWSVGQNDNAWPTGNGGGPYASFMQENGTQNPLPGVPDSPEVDLQADNDYYFAGVYTTVIPSNGTYQPVGEVHVNEEAAERAFAGADSELRYHFNLPNTLTPDSQLSVAFDLSNLDDSAADPHYGIEVYFNSVLVQPEIVIRAEQLNQTVNTPAFTLAQVNAQVGAGFDNIVTLKGINYSAEGGGNWMGVDYVQLNPVVPPPFPWSVGRDDNAWPAGDGGGPNATFVQEAGTNPLPGNPSSPEVNQQADDDYYFAGEYTKPIQSVVDLYGEYEPVGPVLVNEEAAERAFAGSDNDLRYHFNLPTTLKPTDQLMVTFDASSLDDSATEGAKYGIEIYFNGVLVQPEIIIQSDQLDVDYTTAPFTLASVNAEVGSGADNIVHLKGISYSAEGGGAWMGIDYVNLDPLPTPVFPLAIGKDDDGWPAGDGGGPNATFVQENGTVNDLPGSPRNVEVNQQADNDYYFAGVYNSVISANGAYEPVGIVPRNEEAAERALTVGNNELRYHFNLPTTLKPTNMVAITCDIFNLQDPDEAAGVTDPKYGIQVYFNNVQVQPEIVITTNQLDVAQTTKAFTLASVNAGFGAGTDNIISLRGVDYSAEGGGNWMGIDYVRLHDAAEAGEAPEFTASTVANGRLTLTWTGTGTLESAPAATGPWTPVTPTATSPYTENVALNQPARFYRLRQP